MPARAKSKCRKTPTTTATTRITTITTRATRATKWSNFRAEQQQQQKRKTMEKISTAFNAWANCFEPAPAAPVPAPSSSCHQLRQQPSLGQLHSSPRKYAIKCVFCGQLGRLQIARMCVCECVCGCALVVVIIAVIVAVVACCLSMLLAV